MTPPYWRNSDNPDTSATSDLPTISVVVCSTKPERLDAAKAMYAAALQGADWQFIGIANPRSLAEAYTKALEISRGDVIVLSHDDVEILSPDLPQRLARHMKNYDLLGVAGTQWLCGPNWGRGGPPFTVGQIAYSLPDRRIAVTIWAAPRPGVGNIQAIDGVFMAARRSVFSKIAFDQNTFDGFHCYDVDFSFAACQAGLRVGVASDINLLHASPGSFGEVWKIYAQRFISKWEGRLGKLPRDVKTSMAALVAVNSKEEAAQLMNPPHWLDRG